MSPTDQALVDAAVKEVLAELSAETPSLDTQFPFRWNVEAIVKLSAYVAVKLILLGKGAP